MHECTLSKLSDEALLRELSALVASDRLTTASILAHIAEVDARRLYAPAGYPSMHAFCVEELRLSEDAAYKRIQAGRAARRFPALFVAVAEGRLHLAAVCLLAPHLTAENAEELIQAATHRPKSEIEALLARRFLVAGWPATLPVVRAIPGSLPQEPNPAAAEEVGPEGVQLAPGQVDPARGSSWVLSGVTSLRCPHAPQSEHTRAPISSAPTSRSGARPPGTRGSARRRAARR